MTAGVTRPAVLIRANTLAVLLRQLGLAASEPHHCTTTGLAECVGRLADIQLVFTVNAERRVVWEQLSCTRVLGTCTVALSSSPLFNLNQPPSRRC